MNKEKIKEQIEWIALNENGLRHINGAYTIVKNLKINSKKKLAHYTLVLGNDMEGKQEIYKNQELDISGLLEKEEIICKCSGCKKVLIENGKKGKEAKVYCPNCFNKYEKAYDILMEGWGELCDETQEYIDKKLKRLEL